MLKVVIVDDEKMICSLISQLLDWEELGAKIVGISEYYQLVIRGCIFLGAVCLDGIQKKLAGRKVKKVA